MIPKTELTLVLPCFNESEHFEESINSIIKVLKLSKIRYEIILVEDKSTDNTREIVKQFLYKNKNKNLHVIFHNKNQGRGKSVSDGIMKAKGKYVGFIDIDCEVTPDYIPTFLLKLRQGYDIVYGRRLYTIRISGVFRAVASVLYRRLVQFLFTSKVVDTEVGYKFFKKSKIINILPQVKSKGWFWDTEIMIRSEIKKLTLASIPVYFERRKDKTSTVRLISDTFDYLKQVLHLKLTI